MSMTELANQGVGLSVFAPPHMTLQKVARDGRVDLLDTFLEPCIQGDRKKKRQLNILDEKGFAALHYAARFNRVIITRKLLEAKSNPNVETKDGLTPLHFAACHLPRSSDTVTEAKGATDAKSGSRQVIKALLRADGEDVGDRIIAHAAKDNQGVTPLHMACSRGNIPAVQELLKYMKVNDPSSVNVKDHHGDTPLHEACICGNLTIVNDLLDYGADVSATNDDKEIPLHTACKEGYVEIVKEILDRNRMRAEELVAAHDNESNTPMHLAVESGDLDTVVILIHYGAKPSVLNDAEVAAIHIAAGQGFLEIAKELYEIDPSCKDLLDSQQYSPLHYAARANQAAMINLLISMGCDREVLDNDSVSPLLLAVMWGRTEAVKALIDGNCEVNTTDKDGKSTVYWAAQEGHVDVLSVLLDHEEGVQLCSVTELYHHNTPLHVAAWMGRAQAVELLVTCLDKQLCKSTYQGSEGRLREEFISMTTERLQNQKVNEMEVLRLKMLHLDFRNDMNMTPLHLATWYGHIEVVRFLVHKYPPSLTDEDENGNTPLHLAANHGRTEVANFLIRSGAEVEAKNGRLWTPLHLAADKGNDKIISLLIEADAPIEAKDKSYKTPLFLACRAGHQDAALKLMEKGADVTAKHVFTKLNCLDAAVENGHSKVALAIIHSNQWQAALRHSDDQMTPFRRMICKMPAVAKAVLDRCICTAVNINQEDKNSMNRRDRTLWGSITAIPKAVYGHCTCTADSDTQEEENVEKSKGYRVEFNYEFLDDYRDKQRHEAESQSDHDSSNIDANSEDSEPKNKGFVAKWGPEVFSRNYHPLALMVLYSRTDLLRHPVVSSLLDYKWSKYGRAIFLLNLITYLIYLLFLTTYALILPHPDHKFCHEFSVARSVASLPVNGSVCPFDSRFANHSDVFNIDPTVPKTFRTNVALYLAAVVVLITAVTRMIVELVQLVKTHLRYFLNVENFIELVAYISAVIFVSHFGANCWCPRNWQWQLGAFAVFLAWINFILFLKRVPMLGIYVLMFNSIFYTFLKFALIAFLFVVAFCLAFYMILYKALDDATLLVNVSPFRNAGVSFIKTMVMTIGEFEYDIIFGHNCECNSLLTSFPEAGYILWIIFLIVMPILLNNLLVALAVDDTKAIQDEAQLNRLTLQINVALQTEELLPAFIRRRFVKRIRIVCPNQSLGRWKRFREDYWGAEHWDKVDIIKKHTQKEAPPIEQVQLQTEQLSRDVRELQNELIAKNRLMEQLLEKNSRMEKLLEKNSRMEHLLVLMAEKHGIQWDPDEEKTQEEKEYSHL